MNRNRLPLVQLKTDLSAAWAIAKKDMRIYYIKPGTLMFGSGLPLLHLYRLEFLLNGKFVIGLLKQLTKTMVKRR